MDCVNECLGLGMSHGGETRFPVRR
ncbi:MAG: hypothetical protein ACJAQT_002427 [Akkermansiaceae bacterium]